MAKVATNPGLREYVESFEPASAPQWLGDQKSDSDQIRDSDIMPEILDLGIDLARDLRVEALRMANSQGLTDSEIVARAEAFHRFLIGKK